MRVGLNLLHAMPEIGGGWNYIASLMAALGEVDRENTYVAFVTDVSRCLVPELPNWIRVDCAVDSRSRPRRLFFEMTRLQALARKHRLDCMHWFANIQAPWNAVPAVVTVYDLHAFLNLSKLSLSKRLFLTTMMRWTVARAPVLLPMSQATADGFASMLGADPARMAVLPPVLENCFRPPASGAIAEFRRRLELPERFWLYVAHDNPHKNHLGLLEAYALSGIPERSRWPLVLRGDNLERNASIQDALKRLGLTRAVRFLPRLAKDELPLLYGAASAQVYPSLYEGGGMPVIEALACGCPVAASDLPSVREFAGDAVVFFDPRSVEAIAGAMRRLEDGGVDRGALREKGLAAAERFRPARVAPIAVAAYLRASGRGPMR